MSYFRIETIHLKNKEHRTKQNTNTNERISQNYETNQLGSEEHNNTAKTFWH